MGRDAPEGMEIPPRGRWSRVPWGFLGAAALVLAAETAVGLRALGFTGYAGLGVRYAAERASSGVPGRGVLVLGDSTLKHGVSARTLAGGTGTDAFNLAAHAMPPALARALLRRAVRSGARPAAVVVGYVAMSGETRLKANELAEALTLAECAEVAYDEGDAPLFGRLAAARLLPSVRYRDALRHLAGRVVPKAWRVDGPPPLAPGAGAARKIFRAWDEHLGTDPRRAVGRLAAEVEAGLTRSAFAAHPASIRALRDTAALARARGVPVFWVVPPFRPDVQARREALGLADAQTAALRAGLEGMPGVVVLDGRHLPLPGAAFFDALHLNPEGAEAFTAALAEAIRPHIGPGRPAGAGPNWVRLGGEPAGPVAGAGTPPATRVR